MAFELKIQNEIIFLTFSDESDIKSLLRGNREILNIPNYKSSYPMIVNLSDCDFSNLTIQDIQQYIDSMVDVADKLPTVIAYVVIRDMEFGMVRTYAAMADDRLTAERQLFRDVDSAISWVNSKKQTQDS